MHAYNGINVKGVKKIRQQITHANKLINLILLFSFVFIILATVNTVSADSSTIYVNDSSGNDDWDGQYAEWISGLMGPKKSIKNATGTVAEGGTVYIADGNYSGVNNTNITVNRNMTIIGQSKERTIINGANSSWMFQIQNGKNVTIQNLTFTNGNAVNSGGAIYNRGTLTINNCNFTGNTATYQGGAINSEGSLTVNGCTFTNNAVTAATGSAGAIYISGSNAIISNSTFTGNNGKGYGGVISSFASWSIDNCTFINNTAANGGAIHNQGNLNVNHCTFTDNRATHGGAICNFYNSLTITSSTFTDNRASAYGGAIFNSWGGTTTVCFSKIVGNIAGDIMQDIYNSSGSVNAELNWWGSNADPSGRVYGLTISKWIILTINATPTTINSNGQISTIKANLLYDNGILSDPTNPGLYYHNPAEGHVPDGIHVLFTTDLGNIGGEATKYTLNGEAAADLTEYKVGGTATVTAAVDNQQVSTAVTIIDITPPTIDSISPLNNTKINMAHKEIKITFSEPIQEGDEFNSIYVTGPSGTVIITKSIRGNVLTLTLVSNYANGNYNVFIPVNAVKDMGNNDLGTALNSSFIIDTIKPTVWANLKSGLYNTNKAVTLSMSETGKIYYTLNGATPTTSSAEYKGPIAITATTTLKFIAVDDAGNPSQVYTAKYTIDKTAPKVTATSPRNYAAGFYRSSTIAIKFSENLRTSINWSKVYVKNLKTGRTVAISKLIKGNMLYIKTTSRRSAYTWYQVYIPKAALKDSAGNSFAGYSFKFKTGRY